MITTPCADDYINCFKGHFLTISRSLMSEGFMLHIQVGKDNYS
jgi:hypothetical protein